MHIHVRRAGGSAKFWIEPLSLDSARGLKTKELVRAEELAVANTDLIKEKWNAVFGD